MRNLVVIAAIWVTFGLATLVAPCCAAPRATRAPSPPSRSIPANSIPKWESCVAAVDSALMASAKDYDPGDLLSVVEVKLATSALAALGWKSAAFVELEKLALPEQDTLVQMLRENEGKKFMRQVSEMNLIYDRLDRLARLDYGQRTIRDLIRGPDGYKLLDYYTTTSKRGNVLTEVLPKDETGAFPDGKDFDQPTGRIYTREQLLKSLKVMYDRATAPKPDRRAQPRGPRTYQFGEKKQDAARPEPIAPPDSATNSDGK